MCKTNDDYHSTADFFSIFKLSVMFYLTNMDHNSTHVSHWVKRNRKGLVPILNIYILILFL